MNHTSKHKKDDKGITESTVVDPLKKQDDSKLTPGSEIKEPLTPVPAEDEINPPLNTSAKNSGTTFPGYES